MSLISVLPPPSATSSIVATPPDSSPDSSPTTPSSGTASTTTASSPFFTLDYTDMETRLEQLSLSLLQKKRLHYSNGASRRSFYKTHSVPSIMVRSESSSNNSSQDSSLVSSPTDPTGPVGGLKVSKVKKMVRFADSIGLQLAHVRLLSSAPSLFTNQYNSSDDDENEDLHNMADFVWNSNTTTTTNECNTSSPTSYYDHTSHIDTYAQVLTDQVASCVYQHAQNSLAFDDLSPDSQSTRVERTSRVCSATVATSVDPNQFAYDNLRFTWLGGFEQPGLAPDFYSQLKERKVCLESMCTDRFILNGFVRVLKPEELLDSTNQLDLKPRVFIRYTMNNWSSFIDYECSHFALSTTTSSTDRFKCSIILDKSKFLSSINDYKPPKSGTTDVNEMPCLKLEFAVCYEFTSHDGVCSSYWDNNRSQNYHYDCYFKII